MRQRGADIFHVPFYIPVPGGERSDLRLALERLDAYLAQHSTLFDSKVTFHLLIDKRSGAPFYPHNILRNIAMENALTDHILNLDVDFIPSPHSHDYLLTYLSSPGLPEKKALILPSFERKLLENEAEASVTASDLPASKLQLLGEMLQSWAVHPFPRKLLSWSWAYQLHQVVHSRETLPGRICS